MNFVFMDIVDEVLKAALKYPAGLYLALYDFLRDVH